MHCTSCTAHKNHVIWGMSARAPREHGIVFQYMDQAKRYDGLWLVNEQVDLRFSLHNFSVQIIPFKLEKENKIIEGKKGYHWLKAFTKPVIR